LPKIGPAPEFTLTDQDGKPCAARLRGQVAVVTFIFTTCTDTCPMLTAKLVGIQRRLGPDESKVRFTASPWIR
jgi:protein SCO1/2